MENPIIISNLNDFIFCPASIYFHNIYGQQNRRLYQSEKQLNGTKVHETVDEGKIIKMSYRKQIFKDV